MSGDISMGSSGGPYIPPPQHHETSGDPTHEKQQEEGDLLGNPTTKSQEEDKRGGSPGQDSVSLSEEVKKLQQRDREVRTHEQAHQAAGGRYAGSPTYSYQRGEDGKQYAVGGKVKINTSAIDGDPEATLAKSQVVRKAALAPAQPSAQDRQVASKATQMGVKAQAEIAKERLEEEETKPGKEKADTELDGSPKEKEPDGSPKKEEIGNPTPVSGQEAKEKPVGSHEEEEEEEFVNPFFQEDEPPQKSPRKPLQSVNLIA